jgi:hypothetical protein
MGAGPEIRIQKGGALRHLWKKTSAKRPIRLHPLHGSQSAKSSQIQNETQSKDLAPSNLTVDFRREPAIFMGYMAKKDHNNTFGDFSEKVRLLPGRMNLKPVDPKLSFDHYLSLALQEGYALLEEEAKNPPKDSVKPPASVKPTPSPALEDALAKMSDNPYVRARIEILKKMSPTARSMIEKMEKGELTKDSRYDTFCKAVTILGDSLSK